MLIIKINTEMYYSCTVQLYYTIKKDYLIIVIHIRLLWFDNHTKLQHNYHADLIIYLYFTSDTIVY